MKTSEFPEYGSDFTGWVICTVEISPGVYRIRRVPRPIFQVGPTGPVGPAGATGGQGGVGPQGPMGPAGVDGQIGSIWYEQAGAPGAGIGVNGDFALDSNNGDVYQKAGGVWGIVANIMGPAGAAGAAGADGNTVLYGAAAPTVEGVDGNFYIRTTTSFIYGPKAGGVWPAGTSLIGANGAAGADGNTVLYGAAAPTVEGVDGNFYIRTTTSFIYGPKAAGVWPAGTSLIGAAGAAGADGNTVLYGTLAPTTEGVDGNFYIRTTTNFIYGPKAAGVWPAGTSLVGPTGATGATGADFAASYSVLSYTATTDVDFTHADEYRQITLAGNLTLTTSNRAAARNKVVFLVGDGSIRNLTFPVGWTFVNDSGMPATLAANKTAVLSIVCRDGNDSGVLAAYTAQP